MRTLTVMWMVGEPGVGKTTLARLLLSEPRRLIAAPKWTLCDDGRTVAAGHYTGAAFDGADTVPYTGAIAALEYWREALSGKADLTFFDGDRFSYAGAVEFLKAVPLPLRLLCVHVVAPEGVAAARRTARGTTQNPAWVRGRATKARRFWESFPEADRLTLDSTRPTDALRELLLAGLGWHKNGRRG